MLNDHMMFEKYLGIFLKMVSILSNFSQAIIYRKRQRMTIFYILFSLAIRDEIQSINSNQQTNGDDVYRQLILFSLELLCRYLLVLENLICSNDQSMETSNNKKQKRSLQSSHADWYINERDEILYLFTNFIKLDLRQFWHETERLEDQEIGK